MDTNAYKGLLDIMLSGVWSVFELKALSAFLLCLVFVYVSTSKCSDPAYKTADIMWVSLSTIFSFVLSSIVLFVLTTPLTPIKLESIVLGSFSFYQVVSVLVLLVFCILAGWLLIPEKEQKRTVFEDDDLSTAPLMAILFGAGLAGFTFLDGDWSKPLLEKSVSVEMLEQGVFYGFSYLLSFALVWLALLAVFYIALGRFIVGKLPKILGSILLVLAGLLQFVQLFL